jgi:valyl-tRNA synthetase
MKVKLGAEDPEIRSAGLTRAVDMFARLLQMIHPFMPFLSEELWHLIKERKENESISISEFPEVDTRKFNSAAEEEILHLQEIITGIRNIRGEMNIPPSKLLHCLIKSEKLPDDLFPAIKKLTRTDNLEVGANIARPPKSAVVVLKHSEIYIPLEGLIDLDAERKRLEKEIQRVKQSLDGLQKKLSNASFVDNAPEEIVSRERQKETDWSLKLEKLTDSLQMLQ